jgi:cytochrome c-type protein NapB
MRRTYSSRVKRPLAFLISLTLVGALALAGAAISQTTTRLVGPTPPTAVEEIPPLSRWITDDVRRMRSYPEQPPVIPHSIEGYQLSLTANRCLECHRREYTEASGAPMISVTHFMDRDGQMLANVSPRRYFCLQCHVPQTEAKPLIQNNFRDMTATSPAPSSGQP